MASSCQFDPAILRRESFICGVSSVVWAYEQICGGYTRGAIMIDMGGLSSPWERPPLGRCLGLYTKAI